MMSYEQLLFSKVTQLEVTGETTFHSIFEFDRLKEDGKGYSIRECANKHGYCEIYKVVNNYGMDKVRPLGSMDCQKDQ